MVALPRRLGAVGHPVPVHQARGRGPVAGVGRVRPHRRGVRRAAALRLAQGRAARDRQALARAADLLRRRDLPAVAADRLRRAARQLGPGRDPDRGGAADHRADGAAGRSRGARRGRAARRPDRRLHRRRRAARPRRRRAAGRAARGAGDPARGGRLRRRPDDHQASLRRPRPARARDRLDGHLRTGARAGRRVLGAVGDAVDPDAALGARARARLQRARLPASSSR